ncbi:MAG TPA: hypothetical protein VHY37_10795 [Tepidisphaeraceae bacterium]|jgi:hypothetical protein|nr:hypothetical protein [Tepidisphaeraceae bacterium]
MTQPGPKSSYPSTDHPTEPDDLSPTTATILQNAGPSAFRSLVLRGPTPASAIAAIKGVRPEQLLTAPIADPDDANAMLAGLWLWHGGLAEAHKIAQDIASPTGSFWHAIVHRLEADYGNSKYWYARCQDHRAMRMLGAVGDSLVGSAASDPLVGRVLDGGWNGPALVDLVEAVVDSPHDPRHAAAVKLQQAEWQALFRHCAFAAAGRPLTD